MNPDRELYARMTLNTDKKSLGCANLATILQRLAEQYLKAKYDGNKMSLVLEISYDPLPVTTILSREAQLEAQMQDLLTPPEAEVFPGVTAAHAMSVMDTPEYLAYEHICEPANRIGVPDEHINEVRDTYRLKHPECFEHFPLWRN